MKVRYLFIFLLFFGYSTIQAQDYNTAVGLRIGPSYGITVKHFIKSNAAIEGILQTRRGGFNLIGLYEFHGTAFQTRGLKYYIGGGAHIGNWNGRNGYPWYRNRDEDSDFIALGVDGIIGLEYTFVDAPINLALDWKPAINLIEHSGFWGDELAFTIRFAFK